MIYALLIALALVFALLGFLVHAFYFRPSESSEIADERAALRKALDEKQKEVREAMEEIVRKNGLLRSLEQMLSQRNGEIESLQRMALRQEEEINLLRHDAAALRNAVAEPENSATMHEGTGSSFVLNTRLQPDPLPAFEHFQQASNGLLPLDSGKDPISPPEQKRSGPGVPCRESSAWRADLSDFLKDIDSLGKQTEK